MFLDESGKPSEYRDATGTIRPESTRYFTLAGIVVNDEVRAQFGIEYERTMRKYFSRFNPLPSNFKLHYNSLRMQKKHPYDKLSRLEMFNLESDMFQTISRLDCKLLSVTIDLDYHYSQYTEPVWPVALALLYILERLQYFTDEHSSPWQAVYERFTNGMRDKVRKEWAKLQSNPHFPKPTIWPNLRLVVNGDPTTEPMLPYADFFGYLPYERKTSDAKWSTHIPKYYNFVADKFHTGNVEIEYVP